MFNKLRSLAIIASIAASALLLSSCANPRALANAYSAVQTADAAQHALIQFIGDDEIARPIVDANLEVINSVLAEAREADSAEELFKFALRESWTINQAIKSYQDIVNAVIVYRKRTGKGLPMELDVYDNDIRKTSAELVTAIQRRDSAVKVGEFVALLVKILAARQGVIAT